jgi:MFS family permease
VTRSLVAPVQHQRQARLAVCVVLSASFVVLADVSVVNVAAPVIQRDLGASVADLELTVAAYQVAYGALLVTGGRLGDIFGHRTLFMLGFTGFVLASAACGLATTPGQLIAFRVVQGATAGMLSPQVLAIIQTVLPPSRRAAAFAALGAVLCLATILGPLLSGVLIWADLFGTRWRPVFLVNVPVGMVAVALARRLLPAGGTVAGRRVDITGTVLMTALWVALLLPLAVGPRTGWPGWTWLCLLAVPALAAAFCTVQRQLAAAGRDPLIPPGLWRDRAFAAGVPLNLVLFSGIVCFFLYYSIVLQAGQHLSPLLTAASTIPAALGTLALSVLSPKLTRCWPARQVVTAGTLVCSAGFGSMLLPLALVTSPALALWMVPSQLVAGAGFGMVLAPLLGLVLAGVRSTQAGSAAGLLNSAQVIGGGLGVVVMGLVFQTALPGGLAGATAEQLGSGLARGVLYDAVAFAACAALLRALPTPQDRP